MATTMTVVTVTELETEAIKIAVDKAEEKGFDVLDVDAFKIFTELESGKGAWQVTLEVEEPQ